jgi:hypothetical protein
LPGRPNARIAKRDAGKCFTWGVAEDLPLTQQVFSEFCFAKLLAYYGKAGAQGPDGGLLRCQTQSV